jgi:hypothetical protein
MSDREHKQQDWTADETEFLMVGIRSGQTVRTIALGLGRTVGSVTAAIRRLRAVKRLEAGKRLPYWGPVVLPVSCEEDHIKAVRGLGGFPVIDFERKQVVLPLAA